MTGNGQTSSRAATDPSRRALLAGTAAAAVATGSLVGRLAMAQRPHSGGGETIRLGLVGCGGRGTGAAKQALSADPDTALVAVGDAFADRLNISLRSLARDAAIASRVQVDRDHQFVGFDAYQHVIDSDVDVVLLATPPHFRPQHLRAALTAGKHVFAEKPVAVDAPGVRSVLESTELARQKGLYLVSGLNSRYSHLLQQMMQRIHEGAIGEIMAAHAIRYGSGVWVRPRQPQMTEMEYQMRNWYYFTWLSGDFNVEQFVHQYDQVSWAMQDEYPVRCYGTGGRQARTGDEHGHIYDHFSSVFEYANGANAYMTTRHQPGCDNESQVILHGTKGSATLSRGDLQIMGQNAWRPEERSEKDSHQLEHDAFFAALRGGRLVNNGQYMAHSTLMAIMARMSAYTGRTLAWEEALRSTEELSPSAYTWEGTPPAANVAVPGVTPFV